LSVAGSKIAGEIFGIILIASSILFAISLYSHNPGDPSFNSYATDSANIKNMAGIIGSWGSDLLIQSAGATAVILPFTLLFLGTSLILRTLKPLEL
jgi:hypothetical protein